MLKIDNELKGLIPALSKEEFEQLEKNIIDEGIRDPIIIWNNTIIDGHNRHSIALRNKLEYKVIEKDFENKEEAMLWMINNQLGRRNLADFVKYELLDEYEKIENRKGKLIFTSKLKQNSALSNTDNADKGIEKKENNVKHNTRDKIVKKLDWSTGKAAQAKIVKEKAPEEIKEKLRKNEITINKAYNDIKKAEKQEERKESLKHDAKLPDAKYQVIYCDPPWQYSNSGLNGSAESKYQTMPIDELCNMNIKSITADNAVIFMWATNPLLEDALKLMKAWGFEYKTNMAWVKEKQSYCKLGFYIYGQHELLLIGVKGSMLPTGEKPTSIITGNNNIHSKKPECVYEVIESMYPDLKYIELFARNDNRKGWHKFGNEVGKFKQDG